MPSNKPKNIIWDENWQPALIAKLDTPCWDCTSHSHIGGYPSVRRNGEATHAHRYIYQVLFGFLPKSICVRHKCDNPICLNPQHLEIGSWADNNMDKFKRGRSTFGERSHLHKLTQDQVLQIRARNNCTLKKIAAEFNTTEDNVLKIRKRRTWKHI